MAKRRSKGEGTVFKRPNGKWCAQITVNGKRITTYGSTKAEAKQKLDKKALAMNVPISYENVTIYDYLYAYHTKKYDNGELKPSTYDLYSRTLDIYKELPIAHTLVKDFDFDVLSDLYDIYIDNGRRKNSITQFKNVIYSPIKKGMKKGIFPRIDDELEFPSYHPKPKKIPTMEQIKKAISATRWFPLACAIEFIALTGLRVGEICALRFSDINLDRSVLAVNQNIIRKVDGYIISTPKNKKQGQIIQIPQRAVDIIHELTLFYREGGIISEYVFVSRKGTCYLPGSLSSLIAYAFKKSVGVKLFSHSLRHFYASNLVRLEVNLELVRKQLRQSKISTTANYIHSLSTTNDKKISNMTISST